MTAYGYDSAGRVVAVTNALGNVIEYAYDVRGRKVYEGGATYPVRYGYDGFGQQVTMETFRDESAETGDVTTWSYDVATGAVVAKRYADGHGVAYTLTDLGRVSTRTDARGIVTTYAYNDYGDLTAVTYSDGTPGVSWAYDDYGRQSVVTDAVGTTTLAYTAAGELASESIAGLYTKTLTHHYDSYGRDVGYSVDGTRCTTIGYDGATGRIATLNEGGTFMWSYLPGTSLKASLTYPNGLTATWSYEPTRDLLTQVENALPDGSTLSAYTYTNDLLGRRTAKNDELYGYNVRNELVSAGARTYAYDGIGNRTAAEGKSYTANNLNQYTAIDGFMPTYDLDGNQTTVKTATGIWQVEYNAENRPIRWTQGNRVVTMGFDRLGRRVFYREMVGDEQVTHTLFLYNGYLCIRQLFSNAPWNVYKEFIWDPTEPIATRPLCFRRNGQQATFLMNDGNKNVTDVVTVGPHNSPIAHYDYAPFGAATHTGPRALDNPFRFSSEFHDDTLALVYYNYRHYNPTDGRWHAFDYLESRNLFLFTSNAPTMLVDCYGLFIEPTLPDHITAKLIPNLKTESGLSPNGVFKINLEIVCECSNDMKTRKVTMNCTMSINPQIFLNKPTVIDDDMRAALKRTAQHEFNHYRVWRRNYYPNMKAYILSREENPPCTDCSKYARETEDYVKLMESALSAWEYSQEYGGFRQNPWEDYGRNPPLLLGDVEQIIETYLELQ